MISGVLFAFAKELGMGYEEVLDLPFPAFRMYAYELGEYLKAKQAASEGRKYKRALPPLSEEDKERRSRLLEQESQRASHNPMQRPKRSKRNVRRSKVKTTPGFAVGTE